MSKRVVSWFSVSLLVMILAVTVGGQAYAQAAGPRPDKVADLKMTLRDLFVDHVFWVRSMVMATRDGNMAEAQVADRMALENAKGIGKAVASFYGQQAGDKFTDLFTGHVNAVREYMSATFNGDEAAKKAAVDRLTKNAGEMAAFLSSANPNLPKDAVLKLLGSHGAHHVAAINATTAKNYTQEARIWDEMLKNVYAISDALAEAIAKQFPDKFV